jgi:hypothetical protein
VERASSAIRSRKSVSSLSSVAQSALSNVLSVQQAPQRKKRGTSILALFRRDSRYGNKTMCCHLNRLTHLQFLQFLHFCCAPWPPHQVSRYEARMRPFVN